VIGFKYVWKGLFHLWANSQKKLVSDTCLIAELRRLDCLVGFWRSNLWTVTNISFSAANSYKKHAWINLRRRRSGLVNEEGTNFNFISIAWPHVVMFEVIGTDLN